MFTAIVSQTAVNSTPAAIVTVAVVLVALAVMAIIAVRNFGPSTRSRRK